MQTRQINRKVTAGWSLAKRCEEIPSCLLDMAQTSWYQVDNVINKTTNINIS